MALQPIVDIRTAKTYEYEAMAGFAQKTGTMLVAEGASTAEDPLPLMASAGRERSLSSAGGSS